jgi:gliding motility-associated lipoprotein GldH
MIKGTNRFLTVFLLVLFSLLIVSCNKKVIYTDSVTLPGKMWNLSNIAEFSFPVSDTVTSADVLFSIRTGADYPYRNIYLFVSAYSPDGKTITDTLQYELADEKGNWYGKGAGDVHELNLPYKTNIYFPLKGTYIFKIQHGMRIGDLQGVYDIGIRIVKPGM